jgi:hypothetical protein
LGISHKPRSIESFLRQDANLDPLRRELARQTRALAHVRALLPAELAAHLLAVRVDPPRLVLFTDASAWAARLRFAAPQLLAALRRPMPSLNAVHVKVHQPDRPARRPEGGPVLSGAAARAIREVGESMTDEALRDALLRLASQTRG